MSIIKSDDVNVNVYKYNNIAIHLVVLLKNNSWRKIFNRERKNGNIYITISLIGNHLYFKESDEEHGWNLSFLDRETAKFSIFREISKKDEYILWFVKNKDSLLDLKYNENLGLYYLGGEYYEEDDDLEFLDKNDEKSPVLSMMLTNTERKELAKLIDEMNNRIDVERKKGHQKVKLLEDMEISSNMRKNLEIYFHDHIGCKIVDNEVYFDRLLFLNDAVDLAAITFIKK